MIVLFLSGMVAMIMMRTLHRDISKYNQLETAEEAQEETGWKLVHGDVFRPPAQPSWLAVSVGTGVQLFSMTLVTMIFAVLGFLSPANRGGLMTAMLLLFVFMGVFAGYSSARLYKTFKVGAARPAAGFGSLWLPPGAGGLLSWGASSRERWAQCCTGGDAVAGEGCRQPGMQRVLHARPSLQLGAEAARRSPGLAAGGLAAGAVVRHLVHCCCRLLWVLQGEQWKLTTLRTALAFPGVVSTIFLTLNFMIWSQKSSGAAPFGTLAALIFLWFGISVPLCFVGSYFGYKKTAPEDPVRTNKIPRQIPEQPWYMNPLFSVLIGESGRWERSVCGRGCVGQGPAVAGWLEPGLWAAAGGVQRTGSRVNVCAPPGTGHALTPRSLVTWPALPSPRPLPQAASCPLAPFSSSCSSS